jgi:CBS domain-containing protein
MTIAKIISEQEGPVYTSVSKDLVRDVVAYLGQKRIGAVPIIDGKNVAGIFSERDVIYGLRTHGLALLDMHVGDVMTTPAITVTPDTAILSALSMMTRRRIRHLPVCTDDGLVGFVSIGDLVKHRIEKIEAEASAMRDYISMA